MKMLLKEEWCFTSLFLVWCLLVKAGPSCHQTEFLHPNGTCVARPICGPGEQLSEDCGFGDAGEGVCIPCEEGRFSADTGIAPCMRCIQCRLLNRLEKLACSLTSDSLCGRCLPGFYELRSMSGEVELSCVPCCRHDTVHEECLPPTDQGTNEESAANLPRGDFTKPKEQVVLIGSATASLVFLVVLLLWAFLLTAERLKQAPKFSALPEPLFSADDFKYTPLSTSTEKSSPGTAVEDASRGLNSLSHENEVHPTSIVINVTTNIKSSSENEENVSEQRQRNSCYFKEEMEQHLQKIWEVAQGQSIDTLDYDSVQDLSLLLDSADDRGVLRTLSCSLGVPPQVIVHLCSFQDLFQYLRTSTYTLLPQLAQAAALLPNPKFVARIHRTVVN